MRTHEKGGLLDRFDEHYGAINIDEILKNNSHPDGVLTVRELAVFIVQCIQNRTVDVQLLPDNNGKNPLASELISGSNRHLRNPFLSCVSSIEDLRVLYDKGWINTEDAFQAYNILLENERVSEADLVTIDQERFGLTSRMFDTFTRVHTCFVEEACFTAGRQAEFDQFHRNQMAGRKPLPLEVSVDRMYRVQGKEVTVNLTHDSFPPSRTTDLFARNIEVPAGGSTYEVGFGSMHLSVLMHKLGASKIGGSEVDEKAVALVEKNLELNNIPIDDTQFEQCDLFSDNLDEQQDIIVANVPQTPQFPGEKNIHIDAGEDGTDIIIRLLEQAKDHLKSSGHMYVCIASIANANRVKEFIGQYYEYEEIEHQELPIPAYVLPHLQHLQNLTQQGKCEVFEKDGAWHSRDTLVKLSLKKN